MDISFIRFSEFKKGILYQQLVDAYSFDLKWQEKFADEWLKYDSFIYDNLRSTNNCGFITVLDGNPIGHISWDPRKLPEYVEIGHNCIIGKYKGNGYGKLQLEEAIKRIKKYENIKKIIVTSNEKLIPAQHNYKSCGFVEKVRRSNKETPFSGEYIDYEIILGGK